MDNGDNAQKAKTGLAFGLWKTLENPVDCSCVFHTGCAKPGALAARGEKQRPGKQKRANSFIFNIRFSPLNSSRGRAKRGIYFVVDLGPIWYNKGREERDGVTRMETGRKPRKLPEQSADKLREMIIQESMKTGSKLPAEAELMARFGVSRSTVREAVRILQTEHIVDIRQGQGTFLCAMPGLAEDPLGLRFADQEELIAQLLETRLLIEPGVAALAAQRRRMEHLAEMKQLLDRMDNAYLHGEDYTPFDFEFHSLIARCTGNDVVMRLLPTIHESIQAGYHHTQRVEGSYQRASQCHLEMYRSIAEGDSDRARQAAQRHMLQTMHDSGVGVPGVLLR